MCEFTDFSIVPNSKGSQVKLTFFKALHGGKLLKVNTLKFSSGFLSLPYLKELDLKTYE